MVMIKMTKMVAMAIEVMGMVVVIMINDFNNGNNDA